MTTLRIENFAHIAEASIQFGDLTVLVGPQGTGKSLVLQWLKTALDGRQIVGALRDAGQDVTKSDALVDLIFGVGMGDAWSGETRVTLDKKSISPKNIAKLGSSNGECLLHPGSSSDVDQRWVGRAIPEAHGRNAGCRQALQPEPLRSF